MRGMVRGYAAGDSRDRGGARLRGRWVSCRLAVRPGTEWCPGQGATVQAKGGSDKLNRVQIEQDIAVCAEKLPSLICRPVGAQFMADELIALFEFEQQGDDLKITSEKHYQIVPPEAVSEQDLLTYRQRLVGRP